ncbi:hypothetical protein AB0J90_01295 [Micromonospora sp. NPDC049523]|uniref:hypothetical protein n=1 Tax=Micromonospora sp. NPDC049523 TaxID=3155921 RepID=UPI0034289E17
MKIVARVGALRRSVAYLLAATVASAGLLAGAGAANAAPPTPSFGSQIDGYAANDSQDTCDPTAKPGVVDFKNLLNSTYGSHTWGITRDCSSGGTSEHKEGRALDYSLDVNNAGQAADAQDILNWLHATDQYGNQHAIARRLGIMYVIWNRKIWSASRASEGWRNYSCDGTPSSCHTNHIHFSFSWSGAREQTTWWTGAVSSHRYIYTAKPGSLYETYGSPTGWQINPINAGTTAATQLSATWSPAGSRYIYTLENGVLYETYGSPTGWQKNSINFNYGAVSALSATWSPTGSRYIYTIENGVLYETYGGPTGWQKNSINLNYTAATEVSATWSNGGERYIYTIENGVVYETYGSPTGWQKNQVNTNTTAATQLSATWSPSGRRYLYTFENGALYETYGSPTGWQKNQITYNYAAGTELSATWSPTGFRYIYTIENGSLFETYGSAEGWQKLQINADYSSTNELSATWS